MPNYTKVLCFIIILLCTVGCTITGPAIDTSVSNYHYYNLTRTGVIYSLKANCFELGCPEIKEVDISTFKPLNDIYAVDKSNVYFRLHIIPNASPNSFKLAGGSYAIGKNNVYWYGKVIPFIKPQSFSVGTFKVDNYDVYYGIDEAAIYCGDQIISKEPLLFHKLEYNYYKDSKNIYHMPSCDTLHADPKTFQFLNKKDGASSVYAKDSKNVYYMFLQREVIEGADPDTFEVLCTKIGPPHYAKDKNSVYGMKFGKLIRFEGADPNTFEFSESCQ